MWKHLFFGIKICVRTRFAKITCVNVSIVVCR